MRLLLVCLAVLLLVSQAPATSSRLGLPDLPGAPHEPFSALSIADVLICTDLNAHTGFADLTGLYESAFLAAGAATVATCGVEVPDGTIVFPAEVIADNYPIVVVLTSENWWSSPANIDPTDEATLASYLESGGNLLFVGQDYMVGAHPTMGICSGFPRDYLGLDVCYQDVTLAAQTATVSGSSGWLFDGESYALTSSSVFISNLFYPDCADPVGGAGYALYYDEAGRDGVAIFNQTPTYKTLWSGVELSAAPTGDFHSIIADLYDWFIGTTAVENATWSQIKAMYR